jgi:5'-phosphate synthase pdxT subunit
VKVGVLALQGDFAEHISVLQGLGQESCEVRHPSELDGIDALIIPGGESTTISRLMGIYQFREPIHGMAASGIPIWGTCAGLIMMARELTEDEPTPLGLLDIQVARNAFGRQVDSFEADLIVKNFYGDVFRAVFIRAPVIHQVGSQVEVLATLPDGSPVAVRYKNLLATAFHPELTGDTRFHEYFLEMARELY